METKMTRPAPQTAAQAREIIAEMRINTSKRAAARFCHTGLYGAPIANWSKEARREWVLFYVELTA